MPPPSLCSTLRVDIRHEGPPSPLPACRAAAILELRAARGWSQAQTAAHFLVTPLTIASWKTRLDEEAKNALVRMPEPVNKFPELVGYLVRRLKVFCPTMGKKRIAKVLCPVSCLFGLRLGGWL